MALSFNGHTVVITGAAGGLGKAYVYPICDMSIFITRLQLFAVVRVAGG
jgi:NADP-dependent 3-hydroxy acid dehydrogenase YdfG